MNYNERFEKNKKNRNEILNNNDWWEDWKLLGFSDFSIGILKTKFPNLRQNLISQKSVNTNIVEIQNVGKIDELEKLNLTVNQLKTKIKESNIQIEDLMLSQDIIIPKWFSENTNHPSLFINNTFLIDKDGHKYLTNVIENLTIVNNKINWNNNFVKQGSQNFNLSSILKNMNKIKDKWFVNVETTKHKKLKIIIISCICGIILIIILLIFLLCFL